MKILYCILLCITFQQRYRTGANDADQGICGITDHVAQNKSHFAFPGEEYDSMKKRNLWCEWTISTFTYFEKVMLLLSIQYLRCPKSKVTITDGLGKHWSFCDSSEHMYLSAGTKVIVTLVSRGSIPIPHLAMKYWSIDISACDGTREYLEATEDQQELLSPGYPVRYPDKLDCIWEIKTEFKWQRVMVTVDSMDLEPLNCADKISFFHGQVSHYTNPDMSLCGKLKGTFKSYQDYATIHFTTDEDKGRKGFVLYYKTYSYDPSDAVASHFPSELVVGCVTGAIIIIIITIIMYIFVIRRRQSSNPPSTQSHSNPHAPNSSSPFLVITPAGAPSPPVDPSAPPPSYQELGTNPVRSTTDHVHPSGQPLLPPSYEEAISKGMIKNTNQTVF